MHSALSNFVWGFDFSDDFFCRLHMLPHLISCKSMQSRKNEELFETDPPANLSRGTGSPFVRLRSSGPLYGARLYPVTAADAVVPERAKPSTTCDRTTPPTRTIPTSKGKRRIDIVLSSGDPRPLRVAGRTSAASLSLRGMDKSRKT